MKYPDGTSVSLQLSHPNSAWLKRGRRVLAHCLSRRISLGARQPRHIRSKGPSAREDVALPFGTISPT